jgi:D-alanine-D-alanine ligase
MKVAVVHNRDRSGVINVFGRQNTELYDPETLDAVAAALEERGHNVRVFEGNMHVIEELREFMPGVVARERPGLVFNLAYGIQGVSRYTHLPAMLEMLGVPYVGSTPQAHAVALDKVIAKILFDSQGISTPRFWNFASPDDRFDEVVFPVIVKPKMEAASSGLRIVEDSRSLRDAVAELIEKYKQHVLVEQFIQGREFTVGLIGNGDVEVLPVLELDLEGDPARIRDDEERNPLDKICPADLPAEKTAELQTMARRAFEALGLFDFARIDVRMDHDGTPYLLEINSMADLGQNGAYVAAAEAAGYDYEAVINRILDVAAVRYFGTDVLEESPQAHGAEGAQAGPTISRGKIRGFLRSQITTWEDLLKAMVDAHVPAHNIDRVTQKLRRMGFSRANVQLAGGEALYFTNHDQAENDFLLVVPWDNGGDHQQFAAFRTQENRLFGSRISAPYGSVAVALAALRALRYRRQLRGIRCGLMLCNHDATANGTREPLIRRIAEQSRCVLGVTPTDLEGSLVTSRCGEAIYRIKPSYHRAAHELKSAAAVTALCQRVVSALKLVNGEEGLRLSVPHLSIAGRDDQPPDRAEIDLALYFNDRTSGERVDREMRETMEKASVPGLRFHLEGGITRPPMRDSEATRELFREIEQIAREINVNVAPTHAWHASEMGFVPEGVPALDGLGPLAGGEPPADEYILRHSLLDRAELLALTIRRVANRER